MLDMQRRNPVTCAEVSSHIQIPPLAEYESRQNSARKIRLYSAYKNKPGSCGANYQVILHGYVQDVKHMG